MTRKIIGPAAKALGSPARKRLKRFILNNMTIDQVAATYDRWVVANFPDAIQLMRERELASKFPFQPLISVTIPTYNTPEVYLRECIESVLTQSYENWELVLIDDASPDENVRKIIQEYAAKDTRIKYKFLSQNQHIAGATNEAINLSTGEFVGLFDHDDLLWPNALYEVAKALNENKEVDFIYTDEDKIVEEKGIHAEPFFKPDWSPDFLRSCNYITHFSVFKRSLLDKVGYEDGSYNGAQDWEMIMRATRQAKHIHHVRKMLYSWRVHDQSTAKTMESKPYVIEAQRSTVMSDFLARGYKEDELIVAQNRKFQAFWRVSIKRSNKPLVSIVCLSAKQARQIKRKTRYPKCEFIVTRSYNDGLHNVSGEYVVFLEKNIKLRSGSWVETLLNNSVQGKVGLAGGPTMYANDSYIHNAGVSVNQSGDIVYVLSGGVSMHALSTHNRNMYVHVRRNTTALTGCVMVKRSYLSDFSFPDNTSTSNQLIQLGLELLERGLYNVYDPDFVSITQKKYKRENKHRLQKAHRTDKIVTLHGIDPTRYKKSLGQCFYYDDSLSGGFSS